MKTKNCLENILIISENHAKMSEEYKKRSDFYFMRLIVFLTYFVSEGRFVGRKSKPKAKTKLTII